MERYCIYLRKSRADKELEKITKGETLKKHENTLLSLAKNLGIKIDKVYKEIESGETLEKRPIMQNLLKEIEKGFWSGVLVMEIERLARGNTKEQGIISEYFKYSNTKIITPLKIYNPLDEFDEEFFEFSLFMSRREFNNINRRIQRGRNFSAREGKFLGSIPPYGYEKVKLKNEKGYSLKIIESEAYAIKLIFDLYVNKNEGMTSIAKTLDNLFIKPKKSDFWNKSSIKDIITNPVYYGKIRWGYDKEIKTFQDGKILRKRYRDNDCIIVEGIHDPIIDEEVFLKAQKILKSKYIKPISVNKEMKNPFSNIIKCGKCGRNMTRIKSRSGYYSISCLNKNCNNISTPIYILENVILKILEVYFNNYKISLFKNEKEILKYNMDLKNLEKQKNKLNYQLKKIYIYFEQELYTKEIFLERKNEIEKSLKNLDKQLKIINKEKLKNKNENNFNNIIDLYNSLNIKEKNILLTYIIDKIEYIKYERSQKGKINNPNIYIKVRFNVNMDIFN